MINRFTSVSYFRNFIFGVEDSLVSTVGLLSGVAVANVSREHIILTGIILLLVEGLSMAVGSFLTEYSVEEYTHQTERPTKRNVISGVIMFFSYFLSGFIPLSPYMFLPVGTALVMSVVLSIFSLFILGVISAKISNSSIIKDGFRMAVVGGVAISVGMIAGNFLSKL